ncbi:phosphatase PAP2 family protein [Nocardioides bigeumensis]|uniref:Phosphatase PAP2 family protein n=1 Tax=Nocardioides bigeumensis TaxID=433657 RepID=A0ABP5JEK8_9ACTN
MATTHANDVVAAPEGQGKDPKKSRLVRIVAMELYAAAFVIVGVLIGFPIDLPLLVLWFWLGSIAWNIHRPPREHLLFVRDWALPVAMLLTYTYTRGLADGLGMPIHVTMPIVADEWLGGGVLPTVRMQDWLCGSTCADLYAGKWFDAILTGVYVSHYFAALVLAAVLWVKDRREWVAWIRRYLVLTTSGLVVYVLYPMAPPWLANEWGYLDSHVDRLPGRGWEWVGSLFVNVLNGPIANEVAAMPSLHAGTSILIALFLFSRIRSPWRSAVFVYPTLMSLMLVYFGEHYVIDIVAGGLLAAVVHRLCAKLDARTDAKAARLATKRGISSPLA